MTLNIREDYTILSIVSNNVVLLTTTVPLGENSIRENLMKADSTLYEGKDITDKIFSIKTDYDDDTFSSVLNIFSILKDEAEKFNNYLIVKSSNKKNLLPENVDEIIVCGKSSALPGFLGYIAQYFYKEIIPANVWVNVFDLNDYVPKIKFIDSLDLAVLVGLAMPDLKK